MIDPAVLLSIEKALAEATLPWRDGYERGITGPGAVRVGHAETIWHDGRLQACEDVHEEGCAECPRMLVIGTTSEGVPKADRVVAIIPDGPNQKRDFALIVLLVNNAAALVQSVREVEREASRWEREARTLHAAEDELAKACDSLRHDRDLLLADCDRLRRELDDARGVIR